MEPGQSGPFQAGKNTLHKRHLSLLAPLRTWRRAPLMDRLDRREGLFLDSASALFWGGERSRSGELPKDNSSSAGGSLSPMRMSSLPLFS